MFVGEGLPVLVTIFQKPVVSHEIEEKSFRWTTGTGCDCKVSSHWGCALATVPIQVPSKIASLRCAIFTISSTPMASDLEYKCPHCPTLVHLVSEKSTHFKQQWMTVVTVATASDLATTEALT